MAQWNSIARPSNILRRGSCRAAALIAGAPVLSSGALAQPCDEPTFADPAFFPVGDAPYGVIIADFNRDGDQDVATTNDGEASVSVLLGRGDGTLQPHQTYAVGRRPFNLAAADFNGDEAPDLAVVNLNDFTLSVLLGNGDGTFQNQEVYRVGYNPTWLAIADFDGNGHQDVAVTNWDAGIGGSNPNVGVLLGNGDGTFQPQQTVSTGNAHPDSITIGDLNSDGWPDAITVLLPAETVGVFHGSGDGTLRPPREFPVPGMGARLDAGDLNGDGHLDVVVHKRNEGEVAVLLGDGDGAFQPPQSFSAGLSPSSVTLADLNRDGALDVMMGDGDYRQLVGVLLGNGDGTFGTQLMFAAGRGRVAAGDLDDDGDVDLVAGDDFDDEVWVRLNLCPDPCRADLDGDQELTIFDFLVFQDLFAAGDPRADFDSNGELDMFDFLAFQDEFAAGCE